MKRLLLLMLSLPLLGATVQKPMHVNVVQILPAANQTYSNWQNAGLLKVGGIPARPTPGNQCGATVSPSGKTPPTSGR
jgi:hypothetical protein